jgi:hypothetical protein
VALALVALGCSENQLPTLRADPASLIIPAGMERRIVVTADDADGDEVVLTASADRGSVAVLGFDLDYRAPGEAGEDQLRVMAHDGHGVSELALAITVGDPLGFGAPVAVSDGAGNAKSPDISVTADGRVHVVWHDFSQDPSALHHAVYSDGLWSSTLLEMGQDKHLRPRLVVDGEALHLIFERWIDGAYSVHHSILEAEGWAEPLWVGDGELASPALAQDGVLHVVYFHEGLPEHARLDGEAWVQGDAIPIDAPWVYGIRMQLLSSPDGLALGQLLSWGDDGYDLYVSRWDAATGWVEAVAVYASPWLGCEEPAGANDPDGEPRWTWAEQDPDDPWTYGIVEQSSTAQEPTWISREEGFAGSPWIAVPPDGDPLVAWVSPAAEIKVSRAPYGEALLLADSGQGPRMAVDPDGFTHICWYGEIDGVERIQVVSNRP